MEIVNGGFLRSRQNDDKSAKVKAAIGEFTDRAKAVEEQSETPAELPPILPVEMNVPLALKPRLLL